MRIRRVGCARHAGLARIRLNLESVAGKVVWNGGVGCAGCAGLLGSHLDLESIAGKARVDWTCAGLDLQDLIWIRSLSVIVSFKALHNVTKTEEFTRNQTYL